MVVRCLVPAILTIIPSSSFVMLMLIFLSFLASFLVMRVLIWLHLGWFSFIFHIHVINLFSVIMASSILCAWSLITLAFEKKKNCLIPCVVVTSPICCSYRSGNIMSNMVM
jgi:hypothetical protein